MSNKNHESVHSLIQHREYWVEIEPVTGTHNISFVLWYKYLKLFLKEEWAGVFVTALVKGQPVEMQKPTQPRQTWNETKQEEKAKCCDKCTNCI